MTLTAYMAAFMRRNWQPYAASAAMLACVAVLTVMIPREVARIVDGLAHHELSGTALLARLALLPVMGLGIYALRVGWRMQLFPAACRLGTELRTQLYDALSRQGPAFFDTQRTGDLMARATNDIDAVEMLAGEGLLAGFDGLLTLVLVLLMMTIAIDWRLALAALLPFPLMAWAFRTISGHIHHAFGTALARFGRLNDHVQETLAGIRTIRALGLDELQNRTFAERARAASDSSLAAQRWEAAFEPAVGLAMVSASAISLAVGGWLVWHGELGIGALTGFGMYLVQLIWPMFAAGWVLALLERGRAAWTRLDAILAAPPSVPDGGTCTTLAPGLLEVRDLTFRYPGQDSIALEDIRFTLPHGETLGITGATGAGKSTLLRLLLRQYPAGTGEILRDGRPLEDYTMNALRGTIGWVPQEPFLFSASIADNIALARPDASRDDIEQAARLACVDDDIRRLPQGYDTPVGERGVTLSGGQRQRIAIARALLCDAALLLLDDALSAVDTRTETEILQHLKETRRGRSAIIVSHRLSALADADRILVLQHGRIAETGSHAELLAHDGWYARQWRYQQLESSLDAR